MPVADNNWRKLKERTVTNMLEYAMLLKLKREEITKKHPNWQPKFIDEYMKWWEHHDLEKVVERDNLSYES